MSSSILQLVDREIQTIQAYTAMIEKSPECLFMAVPDDAPALLGLGGGLGKRCAKAVIKVLQKELAKTREVRAYLESQKGPSA